MLVAWSTRLHWVVLHHPDKLIEEGMADALDLLLQEHVAPLLKANGFARRGRKYVKAAARSGDLAMIVIRRHGAWEPPILPFEVQSGIVLESSRDYWRAFHGPDRPVPPEIHFGVELLGQVPPEPWCKGSRIQRIWGFSTAEPSDIAGCGQALHEATEQADIPMLEELLDRKRLLDEVARTHSVLANIPKTPGWLEKARDQTRIVEYSKLEAIALWAAVDTESPERVRELLSIYDRASMVRGGEMDRSRPRIRRWVENRLAARATS